MNFLNAIRHAAIGYGIRRKSWPDGWILSIDNACRLWWLPMAPGRQDEMCGLLDDHGLDDGDITAEDWTTV